MPTQQQNPKEQAHLEAEVDLDNLSTPSSEVDEVKGFRAAFGNIKKAFNETAQSIKDKGVGAHIQENLNTAKEVIVERAKQDLTITRDYVSHQANTVGEKIHERAAQDIEAVKDSVAYQTVASTIKRGADFVQDEAKTGIQVARNIGANKAATDELKVDLELNKRFVGQSPATPKAQLEQLGELVEAANETLQAEAKLRAENTLLRNNDSSTVRLSIREELEANSEKTVNATTKLRIDFRETKAELEKLNRAGKEVDVEAVFNDVRSRDSKPEAARSRVVAAIIGQGEAVPNEQPTPAVDANAATTETDVQHTVITAELETMSQTKLRQLAPKINAASRDKTGENIVLRASTKNKHELLEDLAKLDVMRLIVDNNLVTVPTEKQEATAT